MQQITIVTLSTFRDLGRMLAGMASLRRHLAPELLRELLLLCPWQVGKALVVGHWPAGPSALVGSATGREYLVLRASGSSVSGATNASAASLAEGGPCGCCGPPVWVVPEHLALGTSRQELAAVPNMYGYKLQMVLKMAVSGLVSTSHYLVLDSDVLLVRPLSAVTPHWLFPQPGRALYQPQRRGAHADWWSATEAALGLAGCLSASPEARVFGVTPALLATELAAATARFWADRLGGGSWAAALRAMLPRGAPFLTEYCSYHLVSECVLGSGTLERYHAPRLPGAPRLYQGLWRGRRRADRKGSADGDGGGGGGGGGSGGNKTSGGGGAVEWHQPGGRAEVCEDCLFLVVQSNAGVPEARVVSDLEQVFAG
ncbi:hypothetical protein GPECTOR_28g795 [Gonium pectorale]|uniref:Nucleotide-diphospho-sugar transferase domain-containing protein n=1 Tax=Gonium pectorale TaxID=33097 RepID=A0A150GEZ5_GONPE|nr:hypothetical protein GPECTOR_28g795 [Gonium pectorale]|eukprot:KXZ48388.1 hypothetical protein GPECTOR_28g795 [Gonium pectorale]